MIWHAGYLLLVVIGVFCVTGWVLRTVLESLDRIDKADRRALKRSAEAADKSPHKDFP